MVPCNVGTSNSLKPLSAPVKRRMVVVLGTPSIAAIKAGRRSSGIRPATPGSASPSSVPY